VQPARYLLLASIALATAGITRASADPCVAERIAHVDISGVPSGAPTDAVAPLAVLQGTLDDPRRTERVVRVATAALHAAGYAHAAMALSRTDRCGVSLTAAVTLGPRFRIGAITFVTDDAFPAARRLELIEDALGTVNTVGGIYVAERLDAGLAQLRQHYRDAGWARADVGTVEADYDDSSGRVSLTIQIHAGPRLRIGAVSAVNAGTDGDKLFDALGLEQGTYYDRDKLRAGIRRARRVLGRGIRLRAVFAPGVDEVNVEAVVDRRARGSEDDDIDHDDATDEPPHQPSGECRYADDDADAAQQCARTAPTGGRHIGAPSKARVRATPNTAPSNHRAADAEDHQ
jgi:hypothetical protein